MNAYRRGDADALAICLLLGFAALLMGGWFYLGRCSMRQEAVEHGAAEYVMDPKNGESTWRWKQQAEAK